MLLRKHWPWMHFRAGDRCWFRFNVPIFQSCSHRLWAQGRQNSIADGTCAKSKDLHMQEDGRGQSLKTQPFGTKQDGWASFQRWNLSRSHICSWCAGTHSPRHVIGEFKTSQKTPWLAAKEKKNTSLCFKENIDAARCFQPLTKKSRWQESQRERRERKGDWLTQRHPTETNHPSQPSWGTGGKQFRASRTNTSCWVLSQSSIIQTSCNLTKTCQFDIICSKLNSPTPQGHYNETWGAPASLPRRRSLRVLASSQKNLCQILSGAVQGSGQEQSQAPELAHLSFWNSRQLAGVNLWQQRYLPEPLRSELRDDWQ